MNNHILELKKSAPAERLVFISGSLSGMKELINELLKDTPYNIIQIKADHELTRLINMINALNGQASSGTSEIQFEPITSFMGDKIRNEAIVTPEILDVKEDAVEKIKARVEELSILVLEESSTTVLERFVTNDDLIVIRALAKKYKIENYADVVINEDLIDDLRVAIQMAIEVNEAKQNAAFETNRQAEIEAKQKELEAVIDSLTKEKESLEKVIAECDVNIGPLEEKLKGLVESKAKKADITRIEEELTMVKNKKNESAELLNSVNAKLASHNVQSNGK